MGEDRPLGFLRPTASPLSLTWDPGSPKAYRGPGSSPDYNGNNGVGVCGLGALRPTGGDNGGWGWLGLLRPKTGESRSLGPLRSTAGDCGPWIPQGRGFLGGWLPEPLGPMIQVNLLKGPMTWRPRHDLKFSTSSNSRCPMAALRASAAPSCAREKSAGRIFLSLARLARASERGAVA